MKAIKLIRTAALAIAIGVLPAGALQAAEEDKAAEFAAAVEKADTSRKKAASVGGEWRDTGKLIKKAKVAAEKGDYLIVIVPVSRGAVLGRFVIP